jgi:hypothetical protein
MCVSFARDGKTQLGPTQWSLGKFDNRPKQIKDLLGDHFASCMKMTQ